VHRGRTVEAHGAAHDRAKDVRVPRITEQANRAPEPPPLIAPTFDEFYELELKLEWRATRTMWKGLPTRKCH